MRTPYPVKDTGKYYLGCRVLTSELIPNCGRCLTLSGKQARTKETRWYAFCRKTKEMRHSGPQETFHKALRTLMLMYNCDSCELNKFDKKRSYLQLLDEKIEEEMREILGENHLLSVITGPLQAFVINRRYIDLLFKHKFGTRFFRSLPDDSVAIKDFLIPCQNEIDFVIKIQALAGMLDRINEEEVRKIISNKDKKDIKGSIGILEQILKENFQDYPHYIISNLRNLMSLRSKMYPTHATATEIIKILRNFGIDNYPLEDWQKGWLKILNLCIVSLMGLVKVLQST